MKKIVLIIIAFLALVKISEAQIVYVNGAATGSNDGSSWANAYTDLQDALFAAPSTGQVWIASGTYTSRYNDRNMSFSWDGKKLKVYGGFAGTETSVDQRTLSTAATILSGDIGVKGDDSDNWHTVLQPTSGTAFNYADSAWIDGITISGGNANYADGTDVRQSAGGGFCLGEYVPYVRFTNCKFTNNKAIYGGAIALLKTKTIETSVVFINCSFTNNEADSRSFAYIYTDNDEGLNTYFLNCLIADNHSTSTSGSAPSLLDYRVDGINADLYMYSCTVAGNTAATGNAGSLMTIDVNNGSTNGYIGFVIINSIIYDNEGKNTISKSGAFWPAVGTANCILDPDKLPSGVTELEIKNVDPKFTGGTGADKYMPDATSPAIDASMAKVGDILTAVFTSTDIVGTPRPTSADSIDIGCFENPNGTPIKTSVKRLAVSTATIYPNPAANTISIKGINNTAQVSILNTLGAEVLHTSSTQNIDVSTLPAGLYTLIAIQEGKVSQAKFIKQ